MYCLGYNSAQFGLDTTSLTIPEFNEVSCVSGADEIYKCTTKNGKRSSVINTKLNLYFYLQI